jgi:tetratricopeptide (TPR) repeat protein
MAELFMQEARISGEHGHYYPAALRLIDQVLKNELPTGLRYKALVNKGSVLLSQHQFEDARSAALEAIKLNVHSADIYGVLVDAAVELGDYKKAVEYADQMVSIRPDLRSYSRISYLREIHGDVDGAIEAMKLAVSAGYPGTEQTEWSRLQLGKLYERYGHPDSARMQYQLCLAHRPQYPFAIGALAGLYAAQEDYQKADSLNAIAMQLIPEFSFYVQQASWDKSRGYTAKSEAITNEILDMMADDEAHGHHMGMELSRIHQHLTGDLAASISIAKKEFESRPDNIEVNKLLAELYEKSDDLDNAQAHLTKALQTGSQDPEIRCLQSMILLKARRNGEATAVLQQVFDQNLNLTCQLCREAKAAIL